VRVVLADDAVLLREGLARLLTEHQIEVTTVDNATVLIHEVRRTSPDAVIVDIRMPPTHTDEGLVAARQLRDEWPQLGVLVLSQYLESHYATALLGDTPAHIGYLLKDRVTHIGVLVDALNRVVAGECVIDPTIVSTLLHRPRRQSPLDALSQKEQDVLAAMAEGRSNAAISAHLHMGPKTVESHVRSILQKLDIPDEPAHNRRVVAVLRYLQASGSASD